MKKKLTACLLALSMLCAAMPAAFATSGPDDVPAQQDAQVYAGAPDIRSINAELPDDSITVITKDEIPEGASVVDLELVSDSLNRKELAAAEPMDLGMIQKNYSEPSADTKSEERAEYTTSNFSTYGEQLPDLVYVVDDTYVEVGNILHALYNNVKADIKKGTGSLIFRNAVDGNATNEELSAYSNAVKGLGVQIGFPSDFDASTTVALVKDMEWTVYRCIDYDYPEMFYSNGYLMYGYSGTSAEVTAWIVPVCTKGFGTVSERTAISTQLNETVNAIVQEGAQYLRAYDKMKFFHDWLCQNNSYNNDAVQSNNYSSSVSGAPWSCVGALLSDPDNDIEEPVCEGYSRAFQLLCQKAGINATVVTSDSGDHMWNNLRYGQKWTGVDVTWDDGLGSSYDYDYFFQKVNNTDRDIKHTMDDADFVDWLRYPELSVISSSSELPFYDNMPWQRTAVQYVYDYGYMNGMTCVDFGVNRTLTRAEFSMILYNIAGNPPVSYTNRFSDVANGKWYTSAVLWAAQQGYVSGYGDGRFGPNDNITREQVAVILYHCAGMPAGSGDLYQFPDYNKVSDWAWDALVWAVGEGIISGKSSSNGPTILDPRANMTRGEAAVVIMKVT